MARLVLLLLLALSALPVRAAEVAVCYDYGCSHSATVSFGAAELGEWRELMSRAADAADERRLVAIVIGRMYETAGRQSPIWRDLPRNTIDERHLEGAMDCIDHSTNTDAFLRLLDREGALRFHVPGPRGMRFAFLVFGEHWTATLIERDGGARHAVDSWFFAPGTPPAVVGFERWRAGYDPEHGQAAR